MGKQDFVSQAEADTYRCPAVERPFGALTARMGATDFLTRRLKKVGAEMSVDVLAYDLKRAIAMLGVRPLIAAIIA